jgi:hypothetical protein
MTVIPFKRPEGTASADPTDTLGMAQHRAWWMDRAASLQWHAIETFRGGDFDTALLRDAAGRWTYGCRLKRTWCRFTEGACWPLSDFVPVEWADITIDDAIVLSQE